ncbi:PTS sugar transporter subunit IIC [Synergistaceae bacterium OttesenSCG-928-I11]|nr:PTS sugar transporter subunit IIC [Synergistaceae bacterium OttesenSCG-928-I11]
MGLGLFSSLIVGLILKQIGVYAGVELLTTLGTTAQLAMGPAIAAGIAYSTGAPPLALFSSLVVGAIGAGTFAGATPAIGEPMGAAVAAACGVWAGKFAAQRSGGSIDILLIPVVTIVSGGLVGVTAAPWVAALMKGIGSVVNLATEMHPFTMGVVVSTIMGIVLTLPISSAALAISLGLSGLAAGASVVGCCCQMVGFAVASFRENGVGGLISQGVGTSMIQMPNIVKNPWIWLPPTLASAILGPVSTLVFRMENNSIGAGMGTSGLVGQVGAFTVMGRAAWPGVLFLHIALPALLSWIFAELMRKKGLIADGDMKLSVR